MEDSAVIQIRLPDSRHQYTKSHLASLTKKRQPNPTNRMSAAKMNKYALSTLHRIETPAEQVLEKRRATLPSSTTPSSEAIDEYHSSPAQTEYADPSTDTHATTYPEREIAEAGVKWGCLKQGALPTYRTYRKSLGPSLSNPPPPPPPTYSILDPSISLTPITNIEVPTPVPTTADLLKKHREACAEQNKYKPPPRMQRRTVRRVRVTGLSKDKKRVHVAVSHPTRTTHSSISVIDKKRYLIQHHLIDPGSTAPADIIHELYMNATTGDSIQVASS